ncbi:Tetratricopeptide repeat-containing protein [Carboxydocella thermautotrophica]|nr:Tetratricopeptide repeat-containing protein [Carboxydocella thermautotrophica]
MADISLCLIVRNEAESLATCLSSAQPWVAEIIVVDTGSTDDTRAIAARFTDKIYTFPWQDDFAAARNFALDQARGEWILVLDADEYLEPESAAFLPQLVTNASGVDAYLLPVKNLLVPDGSDWHLSWVLRLFRQDPWMRFQGQIHEQIMVPSGYRTEIASKGPLIIHSGYLPERRQNKHQRNLDLLQRALAAQPDNPYYHYYLGVEYLYIRNYQAAWEEFSLALAQIPPAVILFRTATVMNAFQCLSALERWQEALNMLEAEIKVYPDFPDYHYALGLCYRALDDHRQAASAFQTALARTGPAFGGTSRAGVTGFRSLYYLGLSYRALRQHWQAVIAWTKALLDNPTFAPALKELVTCWLELADGLTVLRWLYYHFNLNNPAATLLVCRIFLEHFQTAALNLLLENTSCVALADKFLLMGEAAMLEGEFSKALAYFQQIPAKNHRRPAALIWSCLAAYLSRQELTPILTELNSIPDGQANASLLNWLLEQQSVSPSGEGIARDLAVQVYQTLCRLGCSEPALRLANWLNEQQNFPVRELAWQAALTRMIEISNRLLAASPPLEVARFYQELSQYWLNRLPLIAGGD